MDTTFAGDSSAGVSSNNTLCHPSASPRGFPPAALIPREFPSRVRDPHGLGIHKSTRAKMRELSAIPTLFDAADRHAGVRRRHTIDEDTTGIEIPGHFTRQAHVPRPYISAQSKLACIRRINGCIDIRDAGDGRDRAKRLVVERGHSLRHTAQHSGHVEGALALLGFAST